MTDATFDTMTDTAALAESRRARLARAQRRRRVIRVLPWASVLVLLVGWQLVGRSINPIFLSTPTQVAQATADMVGTHELISNTWVTLWTFLVGLALGMLIGAPLGMVLGRSPVAASLLDVQVRLLYSLPVIALFPLFILWFGLGVKLRLISIFLSAVLPVIINAEAGVRSVDPTLVELGQVYGARRREIFRKIVAPATVPFLASGFKIAIGRTIVTTIGIELLTSQEGLGGLMAFYGNQLQTARYFAPLAVAAALSLLMYWVGDRVERHFSAWRPQLP
jgi:NitT/TauT family transport system permease protein